LVLEEIVEQENVEEDPDVVGLSISLHIHSLWNNTVIENWEHYRKAVENLRKKLPNLKTLRPSGGHSFNYRNAVTFYTLMV
jgi:diaminopimelate decarboxylase